MSAGCLTLTPTLSLSLTLTLTLTKVTDSFVSSFWYLDSLGVLALAGTQVVCRQTLLGGSYGLVELGGPPEAAGGGPPPRRLNSDLYAATLWRRYQPQP